MDETTRRSTKIDPLQEINLRLSRCLKAAFRQNLLETAALAATAIVVFSLLGASDDQIGTKLLLVTLVLSILAGHCYQMMRHHECESLILKQLEMSARDRAKTGRLYDLSILDPLTGLHNRRFGEQRLKEAIGQSKENGDCLGVVLIDLDYFKETNDQFGHAAGDLALKEFSRSVRKAIRACDTPVRLGGDEFLSGPARVPQRQGGRDSGTYAKKAGRRAGPGKLSSPMNPSAQRTSESPGSVGWTTEPAQRRS